MPILNKMHPLIFARALILEAATSILLLPLVYYSQGLKVVARATHEKIIWLERYFALGLSFKTFFTPLYGDYSRSGRVVGVLMRVGLLITRLSAFLLATLVLVLLFILYGILPFLAIYLLINPNIISYLYQRVGFLF